MQFSSAASSHVGQVRDENQDAFLVRDDVGLYVVADGMGGHQGGQTASRLAVQAVGDSFAAALSQTDPAAMLQSAIHAACAAVFEAASQDPALQGMGTTLTTLWVQGAKAFVGHVGDSRCYLVRQGQIAQITDDHSLVNEQIKLGLMTPEEARDSHLKNIITRSVGFERSVAVDVFEVDLEPNDRLLLCSDGLTNLVDDQEICHALWTLPLQAVPQHLIDSANANGGDDNITVVCVLAKT